MAASRLLPEAMIHDKSQLKLFVLDGQYTIRFKKLDGDLRSCNQPSEQVRAFRSQKQIEGEPSVHNLEAGYVVSDDDSRISSYHLACPNGTKFYWNLELEAEQAIFSTPDLLEGSDNNDDEMDDSPARFGRKKTDIVIPFRKDDDK